MARHGMENSRELVAPLRERGITLSESPIYRLVEQDPERISFKVLTALCDIFNGEVNELVTFTTAIAKSKRQGGRHCDRCNRWGNQVAKIRVHWPDGAIRRICFTTVTHTRGDCLSCGDSRLLPGKTADGANICREITEDHVPRRETRSTPILTQEEFRSRTESPRLSCCPTHSPLEKLQP